MATIKANTTFSVPHEPLTKLLSDSHPTARDIRLLTSEIYANASSINSSLGQGGHGLLGEYMPDATYQAQPGVTAAFPRPVSPPVQPVLAGTAEARHNQTLTFQSAEKTYNEYLAFENHTARSLSLKLSQRSTLRT